MDDMHDTTDDTGEFIFKMSLLLLALLIFLSNLVVLMAIIKTEHLHNPSNIFVAGMALADALVGFIGIPFRVTSSLHLKLSFQACFFINGLYLYTLDVSNYMLLGFTFDRLLAIRFPYMYHRHADCRRAMVAVAILFVAGILSSFIPRSITDEELLEKYDGTCSFLSVIPKTYLVYFRFSIVYVGALLVLVIVNSFIIFTVWHHLEAIDRLSVGTPPPFNTSKRESKAEKMLLTMIASFVVCCFPLGILRAYCYGHGHEMDTVSHHILLELFLLNSLVNPFLYALGNRKVRRAIYNVLCCKSLNRKPSFLSDGYLPNMKKVSGPEDPTSTSIWNPTGILAIIDNSEMKKQEECSSNSENSSVLLQDQNGSKSLSAKSNSS